MNGKNATLKLIFGLAIMAFSLALAYFVAAYVDNNHFFDFWGTLLMMAVFYAIVGVLVINIIPISLGFFFSADILILNLLFNNLGNWSDITKTMVVGVALAALYLIALLKLQDDDFGYAESEPAQPQLEAAPVAPEKADEPKDIFSSAESLNSILEKIDVADVQKVVFSPAGGESFSTNEPAIIRIAMFTQNKFKKNEFAANELADYYDEFLSAYRPTLPEQKVRVVLDKFKQFVGTGGKFEFV